MYNATRSARTRRLVDFGMLSNAIFACKGRIPNRLIRELDGYQLSLTAMKEDAQLRDIAANHLEVYRLVAQYIAAHNAGDKETAREICEQGKAVWDSGESAINEVISNGV